MDDGVPQRVARLRALLQEYRAVCADYSPWQVL